MCVHNLSEEANSCRITTSHGFTNTLLRGKAAMNVIVLYVLLLVVTPLSAAVRTQQQGNTVTSLTFHWNLYPYMTPACWTLRHSTQEYIEFSLDVALGVWTSLVVQDRSCLVSFQHRAPFHLTRYVGVFRIK